MITEQKREELENLIDPLVKFLNDNYHPHVKIIIDPTGAELVEGLMGVINEKHLRD